MIMRPRYDIIDISGSCVQGISTTFHLSLQFDGQPQEIFQGIWKRICGTCRKASFRFKCLLQGCQGCRSQLFQFCEVFSQSLVSIGTGTVCNGCRQNLFHCEEKSALEHTASKAVSSPLEAQLQKVLRYWTYPHRWPCMEQKDRLEIL